MHDTVFTWSKAGQLTLFGEGKQKFTGVNGRGTTGLLFEFVEGGREFFRWWRPMARQAVPSRGGEGEKQEQPNQTFHAGGKLDHFQLFHSHKKRKKSQIVAVFFGGGG